MKEFGCPYAAGMHKSRCALSARRGYVAKKRVDRKDSRALVQTHDIIVQMNDTAKPLAASATPRSDVAGDGGGAVGAGKAAGADRASIQLGDSLTLPCGVTLPNRIAKPAMAEAMGGRQNKPTLRLITLYKRWARGGAGMLLTGNVMIDRRAMGEPGDVVIEDDKNLDSLGEWAAAMRSDGAIAIVQLNHPGRQAMPGTSKQIVAPSAVRAPVKGLRLPTPRALTSDEIKEQIKRFATAAEVCVRAGFDGVQIHGAHGYLVSQFLSPNANLRTDEWGGDAERRRRFLIEIVRATRAAIGPDKLLSVKVNSADFQRGGFTENESLEVIRALENENVDLLEISGGTYGSAAMVGQAASPKASTRAREAYFMDFAERARAATTMPLMITGGMRSAGAMREALAAGLDVVGVGRPLTVEPEFPRRLLTEPNATSNLRPIKSGIKMMDGAAELIWHNQQLRRIANGLDPDPRMGSRRAILKLMSPKGLKLRRGKRGAGA